MEQTLGERMKEYEFVTRNYLTNRVPVIIRLDGKAFHNFTRYLDKPFDNLMMNAMKKTTEELCKKIQGVVMGYTQSDEISLVLMNTSNKNSQLWFNNNLSKIISISASICTLAFNQFFLQELADNYSTIDVEKRKNIQEQENEAFFDSRAFNIPEEEIINYLIWRQRDCQKNAVNSASRTFFSHNELQGLNQSQLKDKLLNKKQIDFDNFYCSEFKNGITFIKQNYTRVGRDNLGIIFTANSKIWETTTNTFEENREFFLNYLEENKG